MTTGTIHPIAEQLLSDAERLTAVVDAGGDWAGASPCEGWTATDVLDHLISSQRDFLGQHADLGPEPQGEPEGRWAAHWSAVRAVLTADLIDQEYDGVFGRTTVGATLDTYFGMDLLVHRWDMGTGLGQQITFTDSELDRIEQKLDELGDNIYKYGAAKPALPVADGASRQVAVLGRLGRRSER
jgi:uncharacterized protein (TIGR03083 family)